MGHHDSCGVGTGQLVLTFTLVVACPIADWPFPRSLSLLVLAMALLVAFYQDLLIVAGVSSLLLAIPTNPRSTFPFPARLLDGAYTNFPLPPSTCLRSNQLFTLLQLV